jgi:sterol 14-demethylase
VIGHTVEFVRSTIDLLFRAQRELGEVAGLRIANKNMVALFGPEAHEAVFRAPDSQLNPAEAYKIMTPVFGKNMVYDAPPERMDEQLKMLLPALKDRRMRTYGEIIVEEVEASIADWGDEGEIDLVDYCRVLTNFTSAHCLLGREFRHDMTHEFAQVYHDLERGITPLAYINAHLPLPSFRARDKARVRLVEMIGAIIEARRESGEEGEDFLQTLIEARYQSGKALTDDEITGMLLASMFAGHHTSSVTTAWTILELIQNPACRRTIVDQVDELHERDGAVSFESLRDFTEGDSAVMEALRLHPPLFLLIRVVMREFEFKDYRFPVGTWLLLSPTVSQRIPEAFEDADCFDPQRFSAERIKTMPAAPVRILVHTRSDRIRFPRPRDRPESTVSHSLPAPAADAANAGPRGIPGDRIRTDNRRDALPGGLRSRSLSESRGLHGRRPRGLSRQPGWQGHADPRATATGVEDQGRSRREELPDRDPPDRRTSDPTRSFERVGGNR